jgi:UDP-N-acetylmuramoyl-tripeptide--D-alanyl-D-alanine ligase
VTAGGREDVALRLVGRHQVANALAAAAVALTEGMAAGTLAQLLSAARPRSRWRMELAESPGGIVVLNDSYNANPEAMRAALETLHGLAAATGRRAVAVLGEMRELGPAAEAAHHEVGELARGLGIDLVVAVGTGTRSLAGAAGPAAVWVPDVPAAITAVTSLVSGADVVLVKASRSVGLERVAAVLLATPSGEPAR